MSLSILHVNYYDSKGGASIAVERIHESLKLLGVNSKILVAEKLSNNSDVFGPSSTIEEIKWKLFKSLNRKIEILQKKKNMTQILSIFCQTTLLIRSIILIVIL